MTTSLIATWGSSIANSYVTLTEATSYTSVSVYDPTAWTNATTTQKESALLRATRTIDQNNFIGSRQYVYQSLEWPRTLVLGEQAWPWSLGTSESGEDTIEEAQAKIKVKQAQCEQAFFIVNDLAGKDEHAINQRRGISSYSQSKGKLSESYSYKGISSRLCQEAMELLKDYLGTPKLERG